MTSFLNEEFLNEDPLTRYRREHDEQQAELARNRRREERERQRMQQVALAPDDYWAEVDRRIQEKFDPTETWAAQDFRSAKALSFLR
jgi:hypothetical protein